MNEQPTNRANHAETKKAGKFKKWLPWFLAASVFVVPAVISINWILASRFDGARIAFVELYWQTFFGFLGLLLIFIQAKMTADSSKATNEWNMRVESLKIVATRDYDKHFKEIRKYRTEEGKKQNVELLEKLPKTLDDEISDHVKAVANYFEMIAAGIKHGVYEEEMLYDSMGPMVVRCYNCYCEHLAEKRRKTYGPTAWIEFEDLAKAWEARQAAAQKSVRSKGLGRIKFW